MSLPRNTDPDKLPPEKRAEWSLAAGTWESYSFDQRMRWRQWFDWATSSGGELWDEATGAAQLQNASLQGADLRNARLAEADLRHANLEAANCMNADLRGANVEQARLAGVTLVLADMRGAQAAGANLTKASMGSVKAAHAVFAGATFIKADLQKAALDGADLTDAIMDDARLSLATIPDATLKGTKLKRAQLDQCVLDRTSLVGADLTSARLYGARMAHTDLTRAVLDEADLDDACLDSATLHEVDFSRVDFADATLFDAKISEPTWWFEFPRASFRGVIFPARLPKHPIQDVRGLPPLLRRRIADVQYLKDLHARCGPLGRAAMWLWGFTCCFGQSLARWAFCSGFALVVFALMVTQLKFNIATHTISEAGQAASAVTYPSFVQSLYFAVVTFTTLGYGDLSPATDTGRMCVSLGVFTGYMLLGGLISILANKLARLS